MAYRKNILWSFTGYADQKSAEEGLERQLDWFRSSFNVDEWGIASSVCQTPHGWRAELNAEKTDG